MQWLGHLETTTWLFYCRSHRNVDYLTFLCCIDHKDGRSGLKILILILYAKYLTGILQRILKSLLYRSVLYSYVISAEATAVAHLKICVKHVPIPRMYYVTIFSPRNTVHQNLLNSRWQRKITSAKNKVANQEQGWPHLEVLTMISVSKPR